jgi:hypothetical protein
MAENNNNNFSSSSSLSTTSTTQAAQYTSAIEKTKKSIEEAKASQEFIKNLSENTGEDWPQNTNSSNELSLNGGGGRGFLPPVLISPSLETVSSGQAVVLNNGQYTYTDWRGHNLQLPTNTINTEDRFKLSIEIPKSNSSLRDSPYSMRDIPLIFNDYRYDYFKHGLQVLENLNPIENPPNGSSNARLSNFTSTPFENNDPVMFGFEIVIDAVNSPLLNGSIIDFINNYSGINEVAARRQVYEDFKQQFIKFFRTKGTVRISDLQVPTLSKMNVNSASQDSQANIFWPGKKAYLGYFIKKIAGLDLLVENNKGETMKYFADYKKDMITLSFFEDVSLSVATMTHLYKLLYWSKPNGKNIIPENLLRFNCDIIISECRNFQRTRKAAETGNLEIIKDNLSRHIYSLRECQFWFDKMPHNNDIDIGGQGPQVYDDYSVSFDYKYVTNKFERFVPSGNFGQYVGYNAGAIWKIGNPGERENRGLTAGGSTKDSSIPKFFTFGRNTFNENGVDNPFVTKVVGQSQVDDSLTNVGEGSGQSESLETAKKSSEQSSKQASKENKTNEIAGAQVSGKSSTLDLGKKSSEESVKKTKDKGKASANPLIRGLQQTAENAARNSRNQANAKANLEMQKLLNTSLNTARNSTQTGTSFLKKSLTDSAVNSAKNTTPNPKPTQIRENLLNETLQKVRGQSPVPRGPVNSNPPNSTQFFDVNGQLLNFAGPSLGRAIGG